MLEHKRLTEIRERLADPLTLDNRGMNARDHAPTDLKLFLAIYDEMAKALRIVCERRTHETDPITYRVVEKAQARVSELLDGAK